MITTGIFGGTFNPIHLGHLNVAQQVLSEQLADEVWLMVSPLNPFKEGQAQTDAQTRLGWVRKAVDNLPHIEASDFEFTLPQPNYTYRTLQLLHKAYPNRCFKLIIGADNWQAFTRWKHYRKILQTTPLIVYPRPGYPIDRNDLPESACFLQTEEYDISATEIRRRITAGEDISALVPEAILTDLQSIQ